MTSAFDQYLANEIAARGALIVVSDPARATYVLTERIDDRFQSALDEFYPPETVDGEEEEDAEATSGIETGIDLKRRANRPRGEPRGTLFLVDIASRQVRWSGYVGDFHRTPNRMRKKAKGVADELGAGH